MSSRRGVTILFLMVSSPSALSDSFQATDDACLMQDFKQRVKLSERGSLAQNLGAGAYGSKSSRRAFLENMLQESKAILRSGVTPEVVEFASKTKDMIEGTIFENIQDEHDTDQSMIDTFYGKFLEINNTYYTDLGQLAPLQTASEDARVRHRDCRTGESDACSEYDECLIELNGLWDIVDSKETLLSSTDGTIFERWCRGSANRTSDTFRDTAVDNFEKYIAQKNEWDEAWKNYEAKSLVCDQLLTYRDGNRTQCNEDQGTFEQNVCVEATHVHNMVTSYLDEHFAATHTYNVAQTNIKVEEADRKVEYVTLQTVICLLSHIMNPTNGSSGNLDIDHEIDQCAEDSESVSTSHLAINYMPPLDLVDPLEPMIPFPCDRDFIEKEFEDMPDCTQPTTCIDCLGLRCGAGPGGVGGGIDWSKGLKCGSVAVTEQGLVAEYFWDVGTLVAMPALNGLTSSLTRVEEQVNHVQTRGSWEGLVRNQNYAARWTGYLRINTAGTYTLSVTSDDGSFLWIDGTQIASMPGQHGMRTGSGDVFLSEGDHSIRLEYFEATGGNGMILSFSGPDSPDTAVIPSSALFHVAGVLGMVADVETLAACIELCQVLAGGGCQAITYKLSAHECVLIDHRYDTVYQTTSDDAVVVNM